MQAFFENLKSEDFWLRLAFMLLFLIGVEVALSVMLLLIMVQFVYRLFMGKLQAEIYAFSSSLSAFIHQSYQFLIYQVEEKPFPFNDWPKAKAMPDEDAEP
ncbi:MAG: DUF4389 domain-containing protein [Gammaproteobacteria bacterium]|jgi:hypothetical protein|nr:DUF4389 domain-containing protein [Gammaproteobacteria bacterium]MCP4880755.1 DUF4389 domain-containing protein [Gammaproteobacteria bacterium]MDP6166764.1 DUF4389 domain-containing protein [Gammaproteobacteria bacterium]